MTKQSSGKSVDLPDGRLAMEFTIEKSKIEYVNPPGRLELQRIVEKYSADVLDEAGRLEAGLNTSGSRPEVTSSMLSDADLLLRRAYVRKPASRRFQAAQVGAVVGGIMTGMLADMALLQDPLILILFVIVLTVTLTATIVVVLKESV